MADPRWALRDCFRKSHPKTPANRNRNRPARFAPAFGFHLARYSKSTLRAFPDPMSIRYDSRHFPTVPIPEIDSRTIQTDWDSFPLGSPPRDKPTPFPEKSLPTNKATFFPLPHAPITHQHMLSVHPTPPWRIRREFYLQCGPKPETLFPPWKGTLAILFPHAIVSSQSSMETHQGHIPKYSRLHSYLYLSGYVLPKWPTHFVDLAPLPRS